MSNGQRRGSNVENDGNLVAGNGDMKFPWAPFMKGASAHAMDRCTDRCVDYVV